MLAMNVYLSDHGFQEIVLHSAMKFPIGASTQERWDRLNLPGLKRAAGYRFWLEPVGVDDTI